MVASARLCAFASCLTLTPAVRVTNEQGTDLVEEEAAAPTALTNGLRQSEIRHCALFKLQAFEEAVSGCGSKGTDAMALAIEEANEGDLAVTQEDFESLVAQDRDGTLADRALCAEGQPFAACARSLPTTLWLRQHWRFQDMQSRMHLTPWEQAKTQIFTSALSHYGLDIGRLNALCKQDVDRPAFEVVRECVLESVPSFIENHTYQYSGLLYVSSPEADIVPVQNKEMLRRSLEEWLRSMWHRVDLISGLDCAGSITKRQCSSERGRLDAERSRYEASILGTEFPLIGGATTVCMEGTPSTLVMSGSLERMISEMGACGAGEDASCTEQECPCPEGFMCDMQRNQREGSGVVVGAVLGGIGGLVAATAVPFALAGGAGLAMTASSEAAMSWAMTSLAMGGKAEIAAVGATAGSHELTKSCGCFPVECSFNKESEQCEMTPSTTATASSNPFATLPSTGLKCAETHNHHWFHSARVCGLTACEHVDVIPRVQTWGGHDLFGRVGRNPDWDSGTTLYNCANTQGRHSSLLSHLSEIPTVDGGSAPNTVEGRMAILGALRHQ